MDTKQVLREGQGLQSTCLFSKAVASPLQPGPANPSQVRKAEFHEVPGCM